MCWRAAPATQIVSGSVRFEGRDLLALAPEERARAGTVPRLPVPGRDSRRQQRLSAQGRAQRRAPRARLEPSSMRSSSWRWCAPRSQLMQHRRELPQPRRSMKASPAARRSATRFCRCWCSNRSSALLDETDSGLDIDALKVVANGINSLRAPERAIVLVTHYQRLLDHVVPDVVHVLARGRIVAQRRSHAGARARASRLRLDQRAGRGLRPQSHERKSRHHAPQRHARAHPARLRGSRRALPDAAVRARRARRAAAQLRELGLALGARRAVALRQSARLRALSSIPARERRRGPERRSRRSSCPHRLPGFERLVFVDGVRRAARVGAHPESHRRADRAAGSSWPRRAAPGSCCATCSRSDTAALRVAATPPRSSCCS